MFKTLAAVVLLCASLPSHVMGLSVATNDAVSATSNGAPNQVIQWNKTLLVILRTPHSQPANLHPTRSYAMLHVAIYDAVESGNTLVARTLVLVISLLTVGIVFLANRLEQRRPT